MFKFRVALALFVLSNLALAQDATPWVKYTDGERGMTAEFPATPQTATETDESGMTSYIATAVAEGSFYLVQFNTAKRGNNLDRDLSEARDGFLGAMEGAHATSQRRMQFIKTNGTAVPAIEFTAVYEKMNISMRVRFVMDGERVYSQVASCPNGNDCLMRVCRFMDSFQITR